MEIARLEVSMQRHIDRMQETAKVNYVQYGKSSKKKSKPGKFQQHTASGSSGGSSGNAGNPSNMVERVRKFHYLQTFVGDVVKADTRKDRIVKLWKQCVGTVPSRDTLRRFA